MHVNFVYMYKNVEMLTGGGTADPADVRDGPGVTPPP